MWPKYSSKEISAVVNVLTTGRGNYWSGDEGRLFEEEFSKWSDTKYSISVSNGTIAIEAALKSLDIRLNDEVIVTSRTFIASASAISIIGATPVFVDVDAFTGLYAVAARLYDTEIRTTGVGWAIGAGRLGAIFGPIIAGLLLGAGVSIDWTFILFSLPLIFAAFFAKSISLPQQGR